MKGVIVLCMAELVSKKFGEDTWHDVLEKAGVRDLVVVATSDIDDAKVIEIMDLLCKALNITDQQLADAFGDYWINEFALKIYSAYYRHIKSARDFLLAIDRVHTQRTEHMKDARPPRFRYEWKDDKTLIMSYESHRPLIGIMIGLIKGVGKYYNEPLDVTHVGKNDVQIIFT